MQKITIRTDDQEVLETVRTRLAKARGRLGDRGVVTDAEIIAAALVRYVEHLDTFAGGE